MTIFPGLKGKKKRTSELFFASMLHFVYFVFTRLVYFAFMVQMQNLNKNNMGKPLY